MKINLGTFSDDSINQENKKYNHCIKRINKEEKDNFRSPFEVDYNRVIHSTAYRRLKHKTQVFFASENDHICTRIEHSNLVSSISYTIAHDLGLNTEITSAISIGHDLGHPPFGHAGEEILKRITETNTDKKFWHEKNSLRFIDEIETLEDKNGIRKNLNLTYAVRDGIISHCGESFNIAIFPRNMAIDLNLIDQVNQYQPFTWEACVVKISDRISFLGRDIEDAITLKILGKKQLRELKDSSLYLLKDSSLYPINRINNSSIIHTIISDLIQNSNPQDGLCFSDEIMQFINTVYEFNFKNIYDNERLDIYKKFINLVINSIFNILADLYKGEDTLNNFDYKKKSYCYPTLVSKFYEWLKKYSNMEYSYQKNKDHFKKIYNLDSRESYLLAIIDFISGMTDNFALKIFKELTSFI